MKRIFQSRISELLPTFALTTLLIAAMLSVPVKANPDGGNVIEVSAPLQITDDPHYDRNPSVFKANDGTIWLFFVRARSDLPHIPSEGYNPDTDSYDVYYMTSTDGGNTWSSETKLTEASTGQRGMAAFQDDTGRIWVFLSAPGDRTIQYVFSEDNGATWNGPFDTGYTGSHVDAFQASDGTIWVFYEDGGTGIEAIKSSDYGENWIHVTGIGPSPNDGIPKAMEADGKIYVVWCNWAVGGKAWYTYSTDGLTGENWADPQLLVDVPDTIMCDPVMVKKDGTYILFYAPWDTETDSQWIEVITSTDLVTWSERRRVTNGGYGTTYWWDMWPEVLVGSDLYLFYGSEKNNTARSDGNIFMYKVDWNLANDHFEAIQPAIDAANQGDIIIVHEGTYAEKLTIEPGKDGLTLKAAEGENVILNFSDREALGLGKTDGAIEVNAADVTIQGFTIIGYDITGEAWSDQRSSANFPTLKALSGADGLKVIGNEFTVPDGSVAATALLIMDDCDDVQFINNIVTGYAWGVTGRGQGIDNLLVQGNTFNIPIIEGIHPTTGKDEGIGVGVQLWHGNNLTVINNIFIGSFDQATGNYEDPEALCNHYAVATFTFYFPTEAIGDIHVRDNLMTNLYLGVGILSGGGGEIESNSIHENMIGIQLGQVSGVWATAPAAGLKIMGNDIFSNIIGIWVQNITHFSNEVSAEFNNIVGNAEYGVLNEDPENDEFNAIYNWWGDPEGPTIGAPPASGDAVSGNVDYEPWLTAPLMPDPDGTGVVVSSQSGEDEVLEYPDSNVEVIVSGSAEVYVSTYESNPGSGFTGDVGRYIDVYVPDMSDLTELEIRLYYTDAEIEALGLDESSLRMYWWNGAIWVVCSDTGVNTDENYIWARIRADTIPSLSDLSGTVFGAAGKPPVGGIIVPVKDAGAPTQLIGLCSVLVAAALITILVRKIKP